MELKGRVALITGGRRLGRKLAQNLAAAGMRIAVSYHSSPDVAAETVQECHAAGAESIAVEANLREPDAASRLISTVVDQWGGIDVLVNLVSLYNHTPFASLTPSLLTDVIETNLQAPLRVAVAAARQMQQQPVIDGLQGKIIHFTDWAVQRPYREYLPYLVSKGGLETLTRVLAVELATTITVNAIAPGTVEPPPGMSESRREQIRQQSALQRLGNADDVNRAVMYLLAGSDFVTGEILRVDGGRFLGSIGETISDEC